MSSLFNLKPPLQEKQVSIHPWQSTIKDILSHKIKHAHNSVKNPYYPKLKQKIPDANRVKFTVIGDQVTKEFIYCVNLVNGLHKYKWKHFDVPAIRGTNSYFSFLVAILLMLQNTLTDPTDECGIGMLTPPPIH